MGNLIINEFFKLKREWFLAFLLLLSLLPVFTGGAGAVFNDSTKTLTDLFFFMNNQFAMFFPMVMFILVGSLFYQEYKNKTYINWITYGYTKPKLFFSKIAVSFIVGSVFAAILFILFCMLIFVLQAAGKVNTSVPALLQTAAGFFLQAVIIVFVTTCAGAIVITLSRNIIVTSIAGVIYGFVSCFFIGSEMGFVIPGGYAYRLAMYFCDKSTYYDAPVQAAIGGSVSSIMTFTALLLTGLAIFAHKRKIES